MSVRHHTLWSDPRLPDLYDALDEVANSLPSGSTERGLIAEAMSKITLADEYIEKRIKEDAT